MVKSSHAPASRWLLRTPLLPWDHGKTVDELLADPVVRAAIAVASPDLAAAGDTPAARRALVRYLLRMSGRATPFGLFAGVSVGTFGANTSLDVAARDQYYARLLQVSPGEADRDRVRYRVNPSLYAVAGRLRYIEGGHLIEIECSAELDAAVARAREGASLAEIAAALADLAEREDAEAFVDELVATEILVAAPAVGPISVSLTLSLDSLSPERIWSPVDLYKPAQAVLGPRIVAEIRRAVELLRLVGRGPDEDPWPAFRAAFDARWGERAVPLAEVLDPDVGIGFGKRDVPPLLAELGIASRAGVAPRAWTRRDDALVRIATSGAREVDLSDIDIASLAREPAASLHHTCVFIGALAAESAAAADAGDFMLLAHAVAGPAAAAIARWNDPDIDTLARELAAADENSRQDAVFAEIGRGDLHQYSIPYSGSPRTVPFYELALDDLEVAIVGDRVTLRSRRLGREIIPRVPDAHDHTTSPLPIYRFLCALCWQDGVSAEWSWGPLEAAAFLPRVRAGRVVLSRARWRLDADDLRALADEGTRPRALAELRARLAWPRYVCAADGDRELPVDLDDPVAADALADLIASRDTAIVRELYPTPDQLAAVGPEGRFVHELVVPLVRTEPPPARRAPPQPTSARRSFPPGSEWFYAKLYVGTGLADEVLHTVVAPLVAELRPPRWFYLRYGDHLRVRLQADATAALRARLAAAGEPCWRVAIDTYDRELERYPEIDTVENLFTADSDAALALIARGDDERELVALRSLDRWLDDLGLDLPAKLALATRVRDTLGAEHGLDTEARRRIGAYFRGRRDDLAAALAAPDDVLAARSARVRSLVAALRPDIVLASDIVHTSTNRLIPAAPRAHELVIYELLRRLYLAGMHRPPG